MNRWQFKRDLEHIISSYSLDDLYQVSAYQLSEVMLQALDNYIKLSGTKDWSIPISKQLD